MSYSGIFSKASGRLSLAFADQNKEERFLSQQRDNTAEQLRWACVVGAAIMLGFAWQDTLISTTGYKAIIIRILGALPISAMAWYLSRNLGVRRFISYISAFFWLIYACLTAALFISYGPGPYGLTSSMGLGSFLIIIFGVFTFSNLRLWPSILVGLSTLLVYTVSVALWSEAVFADFIMGDFLTVVALMIGTAIKTLFTERAQRQQFETSELLHQSYTVVEQQVRERTAELQVSNTLLTAEIAERKKADDVLLESEERFRQIAESAEEWIWEVNKDGLYTYSSPVVEKILGYKPAEIVGIKHFYDFFPFDMREQMKKEVFEGFAAKRAFTGYVNSNTHKNGSVIIMETSGAPIFDNRGDLLGYRGVDVDITERRKLEDQLRHAQKMEAVGTLAGGIAHDFNNILNVIMGFGTMVIERIGDDPLSKEQMNEVLSAAERAVNLTKRLLVFSRKQVVEVKPVNINDLILGLQKMLGRIIRENIAFKLDLADRPLIVLADAGQIEQVLMNLASNARDAMPEGGRLTIGTGLRELDDEYVAAYGYGKPGKYALITVADTGQGMDEETREKIFEPFFTTKGIGEGTGLGLAISYGIIKQHSGYIKVYSELGKGTEFKIYLPLIEETAVLEMKTEAAVPARGGNETILLAEDDAALRKLSRIILESYGYTVITAEDGEDAITKFMDNREKISLALIDMIMPKKNGKEVAAEISKMSPRTKILFASGYTMDIIMTRELTESGFDFILKPVLPRDLLKKVREVLDR